MFEDLRHRRKNIIKNIVAWGIFGAIILVFIFWGAGSRLSNSMGTGAGAAAHVNSELITLADVNEAVENLQRNPYIGQLAQGEEGHKRVQMLAVNELINSELAVQAAQKEGFRAADGQVRDIIVGIPAFSQDGKFQRERYNMYLEQIHRTPAEFEDKLRREEVVRSTERILRAGLRPSKIEIEKQQELSKMKADVEFVGFTDAQIGTAAEITSTEVQAFLAKKENEARITEYFNLHKADFSSDEQVHARHILIKAEKGNADSLAKARAKADDVEKRLKNKEDFAKLAKELSEDGGSKAAGGDLGFFTKDKMVNEFAKAAFGLRTGEISGPVQTDFGYHIIEVLEKKPAKTGTLEENKTAIAKILLGQDRAQADVAMLKEALRKEDVVAVNQWIQKHKLKWEETGVFNLESERIPKIGNNEEFAHLAFSLNEKKPLATSLVRQGPSQYIVRFKAVASTQSDQRNLKAALLDKPDYLGEYMANQRAQDAFQRWVADTRKTAKISINPAIGENTTSPQDAPPF